MRKGQKVDVPKDRDKDVRQRGTGAHTKSAWNQNNTLTPPQKETVPTTPVPTRRKGNLENWSHRGQSQTNSPKTKLPINKRVPQKVARTPQKMPITFILTRLIES